ncbi:MAG: YhfC family intramembrane metalloprotease [Lachnospiraceae bacterium]|nr:YhfC family intramembrane metalloprotease [Lachnospiraceae bacterium]
MEPVELFATDDKGWMKMMMEVVTESTAMVGMPVIAAVCVTLFVSLILPVIVCIVFCVKNRGKGVVAAWFLGAAGFFVFQIMIRTPILSALSLSTAFMAFAKEQYVWYCLIMAFTAGLFEVAGRYIVARILKKKQCFEKGVAAGLGHGGIEAMMIVGVTYINNLIYIIMINTGSYDLMVEQTRAMNVDVSSLVALKETFLTTGPGIFYLAGYERLLTMVFQLALSLLVCYFVWKGKDLLGVLICLTLHTTVDFVVPMINGRAAGYLGEPISTDTAYLLIYGFLTLVALGAGLLVWKLRKRLA